MNFQDIKEEFLLGATIPELSARYSVSPARIRYRARKENWRTVTAMDPLRSAIFSTARLLLSASKMAEEKLSGGAGFDTRDIKYLTAAEKELFEVIRAALEPNDDEDEKKRKELVLSSSASNGVIFIPSVLSEEE